LDSAFSLRLLRAYSKIKDQTVQRQLVSLMESIAADEDEALHCGSIAAPRTPSINARQSPGSLLLRQATCWSGLVNTRLSPSGLADAGRSTSNIFRGRPRSCAAAPSAATSIDRSKRNSVNSGPISSYSERPSLHH